MDTKHTKANTPRIGMSLATRYLSGDTETLETRLFGRPEMFLETLARSGVDSIEMRTISADTPPQTALNALERVWAAGLEVTIHGTLPPLSAGSNWQEALPGFIKAVERLAEHDPHSPCPVTVHAYSTHGYAPETLAKSTAERLTAMAEWLDTEQLPVELMLELNRAKNSPDPSTTYEGVLSMHEQVAHRRLGICWDFGHTYANVRNGLMNSTPPPDFVRAVGHTHIHDLGATGRTHWPLDEGRLPLSDYVRSLRETGYNGVWNLELSPDRFVDEGDVKERVLESAERLIATIEE